MSKPGSVPRLLYMILGLILYALGIVISIKANIGYAPWEVFHVGLANTIGLSIGVAPIIAGVVIVIIVTLSGEKLGLGTISSMVLTGVFNSCEIFCVSCLFSSFSCSCRVTSTMEISKLLS